MSSFVLCFKSIYDRILYFGIDSIIEYRCCKLNYGNYDWYLDWFCRKHCTIEQSMSWINFLKKDIISFPLNHLFIYWYLLSLNSLYINHITAAPISDTTQFCLLPYRSHSYLNRYRTLPPLGKEQPSPSSEIHQSQSLYSSESSAAQIPRRIHT